METFTCVECLCELNTSHQSLEKNDMCVDCFDETINVDEGHMQWCGICEMFSHVTDINPYGTCQCN